METGAQASATGCGSPEWPSQTPAPLKEQMQCGYALINVFLPHIVSFYKTDGCTRKWELDCGNGDGFVKYKDLKLPDNSRLSSNRSLSLEECEMECLNNFSCTAFTRIDIHGKGGDCVLWFEELIDMKNYPDGGDVLYIRMARAELVKLYMCA
ncbi:hypothetical protein CRG98_005836 [Punica granatum]|uniref:Apple domain-containing protein n=1 Tax=Punica granatum TaxID=22663 RepID=A0A2I0KZ61_PUNGR|nr:hypothetical protein CRG98_005836 [Punica granatum]